MAMLCVEVSSGPAEPPRETGSNQALYAPDAEHLWNRLHDALYLRKGPDGRTYGRDRFEPYLWAGSRQLRQGPSHDRAVQLLNEFLDKHGEKLIDDPLRRALLQRDLWMVCSWLEGTRPPDPKEQFVEAEQRLRRRLAAAIRRLALRPEEIRKLSEAYAEAVKKSNLLTDLYSADGPWVCVGRADSPVAMQHLAKENTLANSAFLIFLRLPGGRDATRTFLKRNAGDLPAGGQVALVRRALLITAPAEITATDIVESIQVRRYEKNDLGVAEFRLRRRLLIAGKDAGLEAVGANERDFKTGFASGPHDLFEEPPVGQPFDVRTADIHAECRGCHSRDRFPGLRAWESGPVSEVTVADAMAAAVKWKRERSDWKTLQKLLTE
jgi:hypothetical protein